MKVVATHDLIDRRRYPSTSRGLAEIATAILNVRWPAGAADFAIYPESGKARGAGSGVLPIRTSFVAALGALGWSIEATFPLEGRAGGARFGGMDAAKTFGSDPPFMVEWETGNISSSHRAMNKMALGLLRGVVSAGVLIVPTRDFAQYLTDRIGNVRELEPYFPLWESVDVPRGYLGLMVVEHDRTDSTVARMPKGRDGRAVD